MELVVAHKRPEVQIVGRLSELGYLRLLLLVLLQLLLIAAALLLNVK